MKRELSADTKLGVKSEIDAHGFGRVKYTENESERIQEKLNVPLDEEIATRRGPGGSKVSYLEGWKAIDLANEVFGFDGWTCDIDSIKIVYADNDNGRWSIGARAVVKISLPNGASHTDIGWGEAVNCPHKGDGYEKAQKQAVTDARKRALRIFGSRLGNCLYDKEHLKNLKKVKRTHAVPKRPVVPQSVANNQPSASTDNSMFHRHIVGPDLTTTTGNRSITPVTRAAMPEALRNAPQNQTTKPSFTSFPTATVKPNAGFSARQVLKSNNHNTEADLLAVFGDEAAMSNMTV